jgi:RND family efflux transporter MFP subunit
VEENDMTTLTQQRVSWARVAGRLAVGAGFVAGVGLLLFWLAGGFAPKVSDSTTSRTALELTSAGKVAVAHLLRVPLVETAVGTIRPVHETTIGSKLMARVVEVRLRAGQSVASGEVLLRLDDSDLRAKLKQAEAALAAAEAGREQAKADAERSASLLKENAVSRQDYERAATALKSAEAELKRAREALNEVQVTLDWATVRSPMSGTVIDKKVDVGDLVSPGQPLATVLDPKRMQLVASVRESLAHRLQVGQSIEVEFENLNRQCEGTVSEIVPEAQSASRSFQVKVTGPCPPGIYSGMFARIRIPLDDEEVLVVPESAIRHVGQLELVNVVADNRLQRRAVRTGRTFGNDVEVLSGLRPGEHVELLAGGEVRHD